MNSSLYTGVLGLKNHQLRMDVIGNNIANVNTFGFKKGRATFADLLSRTYYSAAAPRDGRGGINPLQVGLGMQTAAVTNLMNQGQLETTGRLTDVAIDGNGWFVLKEGSGSTVYTRDGAFGLDKEGSLVNANGYYVQGWTRIEVDNDHNFTVDTQRPVSAIDFQYGEKLQAAATNKVGLKCNLNESSRSLIADGLDPREGFATKSDLLVDLFNNDNVNPQHLGMREGDWIEIHTDTRDIAAATKVKNGNTATVGAATTLIFQDSGGVNRTIYAYSGYVDSVNLPMVESTIILTDAGGTFDNTNKTFFSPQQLAEQINLGNDAWTIDPGSGVIYSTAALGAGSTVTFDNTLHADSTRPYEQDKYLYVQVSNDTTVGDLETAIQNALDALDVNGTINASVTYNTETAQFEIYNNAVSGSLDMNDLHVEINGVSGSGIRRGYLLRDSSYQMPGTRLGLVNGGLGGTMTREHVANVDFQTSVVNLDYGNVNGSPDIYGQVIRTKFDLANYTAAGQGQTVSLSEWDTGYSNGQDLEMVANTAEISVNGTVWRQVGVFTGAANEYRLSTTAGQTGPTVIFNVEDGKEPGDGAAVSFSYRTNPDQAPVVLLTKDIDYTLDPATGRISLLWSGSTSDSNLGDITANPTAAGFTGSIRLTADYTTEDRRLTPPGLGDEIDLTTTGAIMNNRWADFAQELAEVNAGGGGNARTEFNDMFSAINASRSAADPGTIADQATSTQPTQQISSRLQAAEVYRTSIDVYDSLGDTHTLQFVFTHVGSNYDPIEMEKYQNRWYWRAELPYSDVFAFDSMDLVDDGSANAKLEGQLTFDDKGLVIMSELDGNIGPIMFDASPVGANGASTGAVAQTSIKVSFDGKGNRIDGVTQFASDFTTRAYEQNGWAMGILETFAIDQNGIIEGRYSNNVVRPIAQIALAMFPNQEGLHKEGNNTFSVSANTGLPAIIPAFVGGAGSIQGASLEQSNVDIVEEFTNMIITERGFQANSRIITTSDEMLMEVINLKR